MNFTRNEQGFAVFGLRSDDVEIEVVPELGAKIVSLRSVKTGREWLWKPPGEMKLFRNAPGEAFEKSTLIGVDECLPTIAPCGWKGRALPDHGEVWGVPWSVETGNAFIRTSVRLPVSPFAFERTISLRGNDVLLDYRLTNLSDAAEEFVWAIHPLLRIEPDDEIEMAASNPRALVESTGGLPEVPRGTRWDWPAPLPGVRLDRLDFGAHRNACAKIFIENLDEGRCAVVNRRTGDRLTFWWSLDENPLLGFWLSRGGWNGFHQFAIEPTNGASDALDLAVNDGKRIRALDPAAAKTWRLALQL